MKHFLLYLFFLLFICACSKKTDLLVVPPVSQVPLTIPPIDPSTLSIPITAAQVNGSFSFTKIKDIHPRLFFTIAEIAAIALSAQSDPFAKSTYDNIIARADALIGSPLLEYGLDAAQLRISNIHTISNDHLPYLVLAYQFTKNTKYASRAWDQLNKMCSFPDWGANRHFLDAGIAAKAVGMAFDGLYDFLTVAQRNQLYNALRSFVLGPGKNQIDNGTGPFKWYDTYDNWNGICHGGMIMAALATYEMDSVFNSSLIATCANGMLKYIKSFDPDGASEEGLSYWSYGISNTMLSLESMKRTLGATFGLTNQIGLRKTGMFPYYVSGPAGTASFGDDYIYAGKENRFLSYFWFSKFYSDANMAKTHFDMCQTINASRAVKMNGWMDLLFYDRNLVNQGAAASFPNSGYVKGVDYAYLFESTSNDNGLYVGMHGGDNTASHGHLDAGSFFIQGLGENWAQGNLGLQSPYPADYFTVTNPAYDAASTNNAPTTGRFYYYRVKTEGKNCLVFNPDARPEQNPKGLATLVKNENDNFGGYYIIDLVSNYSRDVKSYKRGIKINRTGKSISIQDEFIPTSTSNVYWLMHSAATDGAIIGSDGKTATLFKNGKTFYARIVSPASATFTKIDRSPSGINYLSETNAIFSSIMSGKNSSNTYYGKLEVKLTGVVGNAATTIRIDFQATPPSTATPLVAMENWTTNN